MGAGPGYEILEVKVSPVLVHRDFTRLWRLTFYYGLYKWKYMQWGIKKYPHCVDIHFGPFSVGVAL